MRINRCGAALGLILLLAEGGQAADLPDIVVLKNGGMMRGSIVELVPEDYVLIQLPNGEERRIDMAEVEYAGRSEELSRKGELQTERDQPDEHESRTSAPPSAHAPDDPDLRDWQARDGSKTVAQSVRVHDGFYFRFGLGGTLAIDHIHRTNPDNNATLANPGVATEIALGGTITSIVLYGGIFNHVIPSNAGTFDYGPYQLTIDAGTAFMTVYGIGVDWYLDPRSGFYVGAASGISVSKFGKDQENGPPPDFSPGLRPGLTGYGFGLVMKVGHDWWVGEQWSLGLSARLMLGENPSRETDPIDSKFRGDHTLVLPSALATITYH